MMELEYAKEVPEKGISRLSRYLMIVDILNDIANQQGVSGGVFTPDQSFINLSKKGILTFYSYW